MKKVISFLLALGLIFSLCACGGNPSVIDPGTAQQENAQQQETSLQQGLTIAQNGGLRILSESDGYGCHTADGYYYLTMSIDKLASGAYASHLMYMDFATKQEIYLCSDAGCSHNTEDCTSVFLYDEFPSSTLLFIYDNSLYFLSKETDKDGVMETSFTIGDSASVESKPAVLYQADLDGTNRKKVYAFDPEITLEDFVLGDEAGIYMVAKKLSASQNGASTYTTSSERKLVFLDLESKTEQTVCSLDFGDTVSWRVFGCYDRTLILNGTDFGREVSQEEKFDDDSGKVLYDGSDDVYAVLDLDSGALREVYRTSNHDEHSAASAGNMLYVSFTNSGEIKGIDLNTGAEKTVCTLEQNYIAGIIGNQLCCHDPLWTRDYTYYFVDVNTGAVSHSDLVNKSLGWSLDFVADIGDQVLTVYDYEATANEDGSYSISRYQFGLISKEDLFAGNDHFNKIQMIGEGY